MPRTRSAPRVLVTGSRTWTDTSTIRDALTTVWGDGTTILVVGACPTGADHLAEACWRAWGGRIERHPADWTRHGRGAGFRRNEHMVTLGADVCLAFIRDNSPGATHTARLAETAGVPTRRHPHPPLTGGAMPIPAEAEAHAVLHRAGRGRTGYVLLGPRDRVCRYNPTHARPRAIDVTPQERDTVHALISTGLLAPGARISVHDGPQHRTGHDLYLTRAGRRALRTTGATP